MTENQTRHGDDRTISPEALARLGGGQVAYMRSLKSEEVSELFPQAPHIAPGTKLWALLAADGTPIVLADDPQVVIANAHQHELSLVSVH